MGAVPAQSSRATGSPSGSSTCTWSGKHADAPTRQSGLKRFPAAPLLPKKAAPGGGKGGGGLQ